MDTREQHQDYIKNYFDSIGGIDTIITCLGHGMDYLIANGTQSIGVQRKTTGEIFQQMEEIRLDVIPSLMELTDNPVLLVEEQFNVGKDGRMYRKQGGFLVETGLSAPSYYNFLNSIRMMGCEVVCTRNLDQSIWWMICTHAYIANTHYPKQKKGFGSDMQAIGMLCCVNGIGQAKAVKTLQQKNIGELIGCSDVELVRVMGVGAASAFRKATVSKLSEKFDLKKEKRKSEKKNKEVYTTDDSEHEN